MICRGEPPCPDPAACAGLGSCRADAVGADEWLRVVGVRNPRLVRSYPHLFEGVVV